MRVMAFPQSGGKRGINGKGTIESVTISVSVMRERERYNLLLTLSNRLFTYRNDDGIPTFKLEYFSNVFK